MNRTVPGDHLGVPAVVRAGPVHERNCDQCGRLFAPRREHGRFCSADCRARWNREQASSPVAGLRTLDWAAYSMREATARLYSVRLRDPAGVFAVVSEAVWRVTIVDAALVRYQPDGYDRALGRLGPEDRLRTEETLAGLRFVRNQMSLFANPADFVRPAGAARPGGSSPGPDAGIAAWAWNPVPEPATAALPPHGQDWERARYLAYQHRLAGRRVGEVFEQAQAFLNLTLPPAAEVPGGDTAP